MDNTILLYNNALNLNLKQAMNDVNDVLYNMQSLKQFQWSIDQIQKMKDGAQMQVNMAALALWRNYILDEGYAGVTLFRNMVRKYYPLSDKQIPKYETCYAYYNNGQACYFSTNMQAIKRKGESFLIGDKRYDVNPNFLNNNLLDLFYDAIDFSGNSYFTKYPFYIYQYSCFIDFLTRFKSNKNGIEYVAQNEFTQWNWDLVRLLNGDQIKVLLKNDGFFAQMGINHVEDTLTRLQEIVDSFFEITEEMRNEVMNRIKQKGIALYSYLSISKDFILQHQNELDWKIMQKNPRIQWDWELINLYLRKVEETVSEDKRNGYLFGSKAMYEAVENYLNDEILSDIEKLYNI